jgi:predicted small lipoprotein YifL
MTRSLLLAMLVLALCGCGAKRDLVLPDDAPPPLETPAADTATAPR